MTISIEYETELALEVDYEHIIHDVVIAALDYEECPYEAEVSVTITDNESIHALNNEFRQIDRATDVLSFPMIEYEEPGIFDQVEDDMDNFNPETGELLLGDIVLSVEKIKEQAAEYGHSVERELAFLTAHSMLHLMGYDHIEEQERIEMECRQEAILQQLGYTR